MSMNKKTWQVEGRCYESREEANAAAKRFAFKLQRDVAITETVAVATFPLPDIQVVEIADSNTPAPAAA